MIAENRSSGWSDYVYANGGRLARATGTASTGTVYYHGDHLGTARMETNAAGTVIAQCTYAPFGQVVTCPTDDGANHYRFTGQERDTETGLDNFRAREFTSQFGRFSQPDPAGLAAVDLSDPQTLNRYSYVRNTPTSLVDPTGMYYQWTCGGGAVVGGNDPGQHNCGWQWIDGEYDNYPYFFTSSGSSSNMTSPFGLGMMPCGYTGSGCRNQGGGGGASGCSATNSAGVPNCIARPEVPCKLSLAQRISLGIQGTLNLAIGETKALAGLVALSGGGAAAPETGGLSSFPALGGAYNLISGGGQAVSGAIQLNKMGTGVTGPETPLEQGATIASGPLLGGTILFFKGSVQTAEKGANFESFITKGTSLIDTAGKSKFVMNTIDFALATAGIQDSTPCAAQ